MCKCIQTCSEAFKCNCYRCRSRRAWQLELRSAHCAAPLEPTSAGQCPKIPTKHPGQHSPQCKQAKGFPSAPFLRDLGKPKLIT